MKLFSTLAKSLIAVALAGTTIAASATPIIGTANLGFGGVAISFGEIDWNPPLNPGVDVVPTYGSFATQAFLNSGSFAGPAFAGFSTPGMVQDMSGNPLDANYMPVGASVTEKFLQFNAQPNWIFDANFLANGTVPGTPYQLSEQTVNGVTNVSAIMSVSGLACDAGVDGVCDATDDVSKWVAIFSAQYTNTTIAALTATILGGGVVPNNAWAGTLEVTRIPEPTSIALFGLALAGLGLSRRRKA